MRLPRDLFAQALIKILSKHGYHVTRQRGSHVRLTRISKKDTHHITIPNQNLLRIGTLASIIDDACSHLGISKTELLS